MADENKEEKTSHVYVRDEEKNGCWIPALQVKVHDGKATVAIPAYEKEQEMLQCDKQGGNRRYKDNKIIDLKDYPNHVLPMQNVDANGRLESYKDMVELPFLHEVS